MRVRCARQLAQLLRATVILIAACAMATPAMAAGLVQDLPNLWASAAALSLALATTGSRPKK
jgi:hypothetical protein